MYAFDGRGRIEGGLRVKLEQAGGFHYQKGPKPLAGAERSVTHGGNEPLRCTGSGGLVQQSGQPCLYKACYLQQALAESHGFPYLAGEQDARRAAAFI